jgi:N-acylneuraminate cytidylyltransferase
MSTICVIPARGGSKRIPRKNVRSFCGRPMIAWSIGTARDSGLFDRVMVSTEDAEIAGIAREWGAEVPFVRPAELADDHTPTVPVIRHAIGAIETASGPVERACCVYATAPFLTAETLRKGLEAVQADASLEFAFGVTRFDFPIFRAVALDEAGHVRMFWPEHELTRSQDLPPAYHDAGQFVWGTREAWMTRDRVFSSRTRGIVVPGSLVQDIDTDADWELAEWKFKALKRPADP